MIIDKVKIYNKQHSTRLHLKAVFFDMDGILFNSMPHHAEAWAWAMEKADVPFSPYEAYLNEGRTGSATINLAFREALGREATEEEIKRIYNQKTEKFDELNTIATVDGVSELLQKVQSAGLPAYVVTGSAQLSLLDNLNTYFPNVFDGKNIVSANDVTIGKPHPEPYLKALEKAKLQPYEAIVIENAPLGVESAVAAGIFTIGINTGILSESVLESAGANAVYPDMAALNRRWSEFYEYVK